jgi:hypothetical protein
MSRARCIMAAISLGLLTAATAPPQQWAVFGLELGKPPSIPVCQHKILSGGLVSQFTYENDPAETRYEPDRQITDTPWRRGSVNFPLKRMPLILHENTGFTLIINGRIEGLQFDTLSYGNTNGIISELTAKFGKPTSVTRFIANPEGIPIPATHAEWKLPGLYVSYRNIDSSVEFGYLLIETWVMQALRRSHEQGQAQQRTKL